MKHREQEVGLSYRRGLWGPKNLEMCRPLLTFSQVAAHGLALGQAKHQPRNSNTRCEEGCWQEPTSPEPDAEVVPVRYPMTWEVEEMNKWLAVFLGPLFLSSGGKGARSHYQLEGQDVRGQRALDGGAGIMGLVILQVEMCPALVGSIVGTLESLCGPQLISVAGLGG